MENQEQLTEEQTKELFDYHVKQIQGTKSEESLSNEVNQEPAPVVDETTAQTPEANPAPENSPEQTDKPEEQKPDDPQAFLNSLAPEVKDKVLGIIKERDYYNQRDLRLRNQVSAIDRRLQQERFQRAELEKKLASVQPTSPPSKDKLPPKLQQLAEVDPIFIDALNEHKALVEQELQSKFDKVLEAQLKPIYETREQEYQNRIISDLDQSVPNWRDVIFEVENGQPKLDDKSGMPIYNRYWVEFVNDQPEYVRNAVLDIKSADQAFWALNQFGQWANQRYGQPEQQTPVANINQADKIQQKRAQDLKKQSVKVSSVPATAAIEDNPNSEEWQKYAFEEARKVIKGGKSKLYK